MFDFCSNLWRLLLVKVLMTGVGCLQEPVEVKTWPTSQEATEGRTCPSSFRRTRRTRRTAARHESAPLSARGSAGDSTTWTATAPWTRRRARTSFASVKGSNAHSCSHTEEFHSQRFVSFLNTSVLLDPAQKKNLSHRRTSRTPTPTTATSAATAAAGVSLPPGRGSHRNEDAAPGRGGDREATQTMKRRRRTRTRTMKWVDGFILY